MTKYELMVIAAAAAAFVVINIIMWSIIAAKEKSAPESSTAAHGGTACFGSNSGQRACAAVRSGEYDSGSSGASSAACKGKTSCKAQRFCPH